jgi:uncharacterized ferritin-like protein (DUF455 family)
MDNPPRSSGTPSHEALAYRVLTGVTLDDKLCARDDGWAWDGRLPDVPGRPPGLALPPRGPAARAPFPGDHALDAPLARAQVLHFFANHELLALELLARGVLRFQQAPPSFRAGLAAILADEQRHLALYVERLGHNGLAFGDLPLNRYFWDALEGIDDPYAFVTALALTFEQANLDFATHYARAFRAVGDADTAEVLDTVLADEIRHVRHGLAWFDRWRPANLSRWEAWVGALPRPLTPARGRGIGFAREARVAAGLDADTIDRLSVHGASRGRPPRVHTFHPDVESEVAGGSTPPSAVRERITADLAGVNLFLATRDDAVLVPRAPSTAFLAQLAEAGFALPEVIEGGPEALAGRTLAGLCPWGWGPGVADALAPLGAPPWNPELRRLYDKGWAAERLREWPDLCDPAVVGTVVRELDALRRVSTPDHVWKAPYATAGRGLMRPDAPGADAWAERVLAEQGALVVEPWLDRVLDASMQFDVAADGGVRTQPWGRFLADARGRWHGAVIGRSLEDADAPLRRACAKLGAALGETCRRRGPRMAALGFRGPAGIDAFLYRDAAGGLRIKPLVELNPRNTMGRVALALDRRMRRGRVGLWLQVSRRDVKRAGHSGFTAWQDALSASAPLRTVGSPPLLDAGVLFTTDPTCAREHVTVLSVSDSLAGARAQLLLTEAPTG